jgi:hypothetical protein
LQVQHGRYSVAGTAPRCGGEHTGRAAGPVLRVPLATWEPCGIYTHV